MKSFCAAVVVLVLFVAADALNLAERRAFESGVFTPCGGENGATQADIDSLLNYETPTTRAGACTAACAHRKVGMISGGRVVPAAFQGVGDKEYADNQAALATFRELVAACSNEVNTQDDCELSRAIYVCMNSWFYNRGLVISQGLAP